MKGEYRPLHSSCVLFTLDPDDHEVVGNLLSSIKGGPATVDVRGLQLGQLRSFRDALDTRQGMVVLCHYAEGRTLLTNTDGLYNSFLVAASNSCAGNIIVLLTGIPTPDNVLADSDAVDDLVESGGQTFVQFMVDAERFLTCDEAPSAFQLQHMVEAYKGVLEPLDVTPLRRHQLRNGGGGWLEACVLL